MANKILVLDAGHGIKTPGKQTLASLGTVYKEWTLNNAVCNKIQKILANYNVTIYRTDDQSGATDVSLAARVSKTNSYNPDLFVSIHHNAGGGTGTEVYYHTRGTSEDKKVAGIIAPKLASKVGLRNRGVKNAEFTVLTTKATAVLVEGGFMDTKNDYQIIISDKGQQAYAEAVAEAVIEYLGLTKKVTQATTTTTSGYSVNDVVKVKSTATVYANSEKKNSRLG